MREMFFALGPYVNSTPCGDSHLCTSVLVRIKCWGPQGLLTRSQLHDSLPVWFIIKDSCIAVSDERIFQKKMKTFVDRSSPGPFIFAPRFENLQILDLDSYPSQSPMPYFCAFLPQWLLGYSSSTPVSPEAKRRWKDHFSAAARFRVSVV